VCFDLGVRGDYEGLYAWLDDHDVKECGASVAYLKYSYKTDFLAELRQELERVSVVGFLARRALRLRRENLSSPSWHTSLAAELGR
jgi:hypothetical protein